MMPTISSRLASEPEDSQYRLYSRVTPTPDREAEH